MVWLISAAIYCIVKKTPLHFGHVHLQKGTVKTPKMIGFLKKGVFHVDTVIRS